MAGLGVGLPGVSTAVGPFSINLSISLQPCKAGTSVPPSEESLRHRPVNHLARGHSPSQRLTGGGWAGEGLQWRPDTGSGRRKGAPLLVEVRTHGWTRTAHTEHVALHLVSNAVVSLTQVTICPFAGASLCVCVPVVPT